jgi:hypothetical protein
LVPSKKNILTKKKLKLKIDSAVSSGTQDEPTYFVHFPCNLLEAAIRISMFIFVFTSARKLFLHVA